MIIQKIVNNLKHTYSDTNHYIIQDQTGIEYSEAYDSLTSIYTYSESPRLIEEPEGGVSV